MTLGGLLKHLALVEDDLFALLLLGQEAGPPWDAVDRDADPDCQGACPRPDRPYVDGHDRRDHEAAVPRGPPTLSGPATARSRMLVRS